jgi:putative phosphoesterase
MLVGVVSDTHGYLDSRLLDAFLGVDVILHAGDVGSNVVLEGLRRLASLYAVQGNNDVPLGGLGLPAHLDIELEGVSLHLVHELPHAKPSPATNAVVFGHSHRELCEWREGVPQPCAAGRRGFHPTDCGAAGIDGRLEVEPVVLGPRFIKIYH